MHRSIPTSVLVSTLQHKRIVSYQPCSRDDIHLSGAVHRLIGEQTANLVRRNEAKQGSTNAQESKGPEGAKFDLKFPPGY